jgi:hypothetical protein
MKHRLQDQTRTQKQGKSFGQHFDTNRGVFKKNSQLVRKVDILQFQFPRRCLFRNTSYKLLQNNWLHNYAPKNKK